MVAIMINDDPRGSLGLGGTQGGGGVSTFMLHGKQHLLVSLGDALAAFALYGAG